MVKTRAERCIVHVVLTSRKRYCESCTTASETQPRRRSTGCTFPPSHLPSHLLSWDRVSLETGHFIAHAPCNCNDRHNDPREVSRSPLTEASDQASEPRRRTRNAGTPTVRCSQSPTPIEAGTDVRAAICQESASSL